MNNQVMDQVKKISFLLLLFNIHFVYSFIQILSSNYDAEFFFVVVVNSSIIQSHIYKDIYITFNLI